MGTSSSSSKPVLVKGQKDLISNFLFNVVNPAVLGGQPDAGFEAGAQRQAQSLGNDFAERGLTGSGLESRALSDLAAKQMQGREANRFNLGQLLFKTPGVSSSGSTFSALGSPGGA